MADNVFDHEEEYRPSEANTGSAYGATATKPTGINSPLLKRGLMVLLLVIASAGLMKCHSSSKSKPAAPVKKVAAVKPVAATAAPTAAQAVPHVPPAPAAIEIANQKIAVLEAKINGLEAALADTNSKFVAVVNVMQNLNNQLAQQQNQLQTLMTKQQTVLKSMLKKGTAKYGIQAMLPGRVWLIAQDGSVISVRLGDQVPAYGTIDAIDPVEGKVITSSGRIIEYKDS